jgi:ribosomal protein S18 acetylase RimI-like enzyme
MTDEAIQENDIRRPIGPVIAHPGPARLVEAIQTLLHADSKRARRFLAFAEKSGMSLEHLWCAFDEAQTIRATVMGTLNPGRTAMLFASRPKSREELETTGKVIDATCRGLRKAGVGLAQSLIPPENPLELEAFQAGGLKKIATLTYMERTVPRRRERIDGQLPSELRLESYRPEHRARLEALLAETYRDTLDCPGLARLRKPSDVVEGHMKSGIFKPEWWVFLMKDDTPVGISMMNVSKTKEAIELVYLGLIPEARGHGTGSALMAHSLRKVSGSPQKTVVLAVDDSNEPASKIYEHFGFRSTARRHAFVRSLDATSK